ncbi:hypothetical protein TURU_010975 [Turdus rufiventris]|nr:hypothetical protein TURU_010975 [Turdus rufiventris]
MPFLEPRRDPEQVLWGIHRVNADVDAEPYWLETGTHKSKSRPPASGASKASVQNINAAEVRDTTDIKCLAYTEPDMQIFVSGQTGSHIRKQTGLALQVQRCIICGSLFGTHWDGRRKARKIKQPFERGYVLYLATESWTRMKSYHEMMNEFQLKTSLTLEKEKVDE